MAASASTPPPEGPASGFAPVYVSGDDGNTWSVRNCDGRESAGGPLRVRGERRRGHSSWIRRMNRQEWLAVLIFLTTQRRGNHIHDDHGAESRGGARGRRRRRR